MNPRDSIVDAFLPASVARTAGRAGSACLWLAVAVGALFPVSAAAGTEVPSSRWTTVAALAVAWIVLRRAGDALPLVLAGVGALVVGAIAAPALWLLPFAALVALYVSTALVRRPASATGGPGADAPGAAPTGSTESRESAESGESRDGPARHEGRELVESLAMALVLALVVREFAFEAFKIPTGSMEPTILGDGRDRKGDRLLAFKGVFTDPERWQIVVFKFPLFRGTNYIKRLVGLPGERLELRDGDVYAAGVIVPKPDAVQEALWRPDWESGSDLADDTDPDAKGGWTVAGAVAQLDAPEGDERWLTVRRRFAPDLRASFDVERLEVADGGAFLVRVEGADRRVTLSIGRDATRLTAPGLDAQDVGLGGAASYPARFRLGLSYADRIVRVSIDGRQVARVVTADAANGDGASAGAVEVGGRGARAEVSGFRVDEDVQYSDSGRTTFDIPDDGFVMLGDNTNSSRDSRLWTANVVRLRDGREFVAPRDARIADDVEVRAFRERPDGGLDFIDADGISHSVTKDEIATIDRDVPLPFVRRRDLIGPAFLVFFPFPPFGEFRPRLLR